MPRNHFYNRRFASRAPVVEERRLRRLSAQRRGKTRRRSTSRTSRARCFHLASRDGAGPPCGHPASGGLVLDGTLPASGRSATTLVRCTGGRASAALSARGGSAEIDPLTPFAAPGKGNAGAPDFPVAWPLSGQRTSMRRPCLGPRCLPSHGTNMGRPCERSGWRSCPAGRRSIRRTCSSMFENID